MQSQVGKTLTLGNVEQSLFLVFGQDFKESNHQNHRGKSFPKGKGRSNVHHAEDDEHEFQDNWNENYMDIYYENDDDQYYECDEEWDETYFGSQVDWFPTASEWNPSKAAVEDESLFDVEDFNSVLLCICRCQEPTCTIAPKPWLLPGCGTGGRQGFQHVSRWG